MSPSGVACGWGVAWDVTGGGTLHFQSKGMPEACSGASHHLPMVTRPFSGIQTHGISQTKQTYRRTWYRSSGADGAALYTHWLLVAKILPPDLTRTKAHGW